MKESREPSQSDVQRGISDILCFLPHPQAGLQRESEGHIMGSDNIISAITVDVLDCCGGGLRCTQATEG